MFSLFELMIKSPYREKTNASEFPAISMGIGSFYNIFPKDALSVGLWAGLKVAHVAQKLRFAEAITQNQPVYPGRTSV